MHVHTHIILYCIINVCECVWVSVSVFIPPPSSDDGDFAYTSLSRTAKNTHTLSTLLTNNTVRYIGLKVVLMHGLNKRTETYK